MFYGPCKGVLGRKGPARNAGPHSRHAGSEEGPVWCHPGSGACHQPHPGDAADVKVENLDIALLCSFCLLFLVLLKSPSVVNTMKFPALAFISASSVLTWRLIIFRFHESLFFPGFLILNF